MKFLKLFAFSTILLALTACGSTTVITQPLAPDLVANLANTKYQVLSVEVQAPETPSAIAVSLEGYLKQELSNRNLLASGETFKTHTVKIVITEYRMRSGFSRFMFGAMAGNDGIGTKVSVIDAATEAVVGESDISSFNATAVGGESDVTQMLAEEIAKFLVGETDERAASARKKSRRS